MLSLVLLLFTPPGVVTFVYLLGLPALCVFLGQRMALGAAIRRIVTERKAALSDLVVTIATRSLAALSATPGAATANAAAARMQGAVESMEASRATRFVLRAVLRAVRIPDLVTTSNLVARIRAEPEAVRTELRALIEPRVEALGTTEPFRPLTVVLAFTTIMTLTRDWWTRLYAY